MFGVSFMVSPTTFALSKSQFKDAVCSVIQGPGAEDGCRETIDKTGKFTLGTSGKTIKFADWKDASKADIEDAVRLGVTKPAALEEARKAEKDGAIPTDGCGGVDTAIIKCNADNSGSDIENNGVWALLLMAINILTAGVGIAAVGGIIYGSIMYTTAGDNEGQVKQAKEIIRNVVIGIILYVAMYALLQFIIPGGLFV